MSCLSYVAAELQIENVSLKTIAEKFGTPTYIYSRAAIEENYRAFDQALAAIPHRVCYAVKANSNIAILHLLANLNSGFDIVSGGELQRTIAAGADPQKIVFSGVGKSETEITAAINIGIYCFDVESPSELERLQSIAAKCNKKINIALRINPNINPNTHSYISTGLKENKFGMDIEDVLPLCEKLAAMPALQLIGIACHLGSQIVELGPFLAGIDRMLDIYQQLQKMQIKIQTINIGGGLGITYHHEQPPSIHAYVEAIRKKIAPYPLEIIIEPGRAIVGNAGVLLTRVEYLKHSAHKNFAIVDAGMNDLLRPALYQAWQTILPVNLHNNRQKNIYDIAGPVCESADFLGKDRELALQEGDLLAVETVGAYGFSMSSNYNSRARAAEVLVDGSQMHVIRKREMIEDLYQLEMIPKL